MNLQWDPGCDNLVRLHWPVVAITVPGCVATAGLFIQSLVMIYSYTFNLHAAMRLFRLDLMCATLSGQFAGRYMMHTYTLQVARSLILQQMQGCQLGLLGMDLHPSAQLQCGQAFHQGQTLLPACSWPTS